MNHFDRVAKNPHKFMFIVLKKRRLKANPVAFHSDLPHERLTVSRHAMPITECQTVSHVIVRLIIVISPTQL